MVAFGILKKLWDPGLSGGANGRRREHRQFGRRAGPYLHGHLIPRFGLTDLETFRYHERGISFRARVEGAEPGRDTVIVKLYDLSKLKGFIKVHQSLLAAGLLVPEIVFVDSSDASMENLEIGSVGLRWADGRTWTQEAGDEAVAAAFANLARFHGVDAHDIAALKPTWPAKIARRRLEQLRGALGSAVAGSDAQQITDLVTDGMDEVFANAEACVMLHMDYSPGNLLLTPAGEIMTLDFEDARVGPFVFDLGHALLCLAAEPNAAAEETLEEKLESPRMRRALDAYFEHAPAGWSEIWKRHERPILLWAYLNLAGNGAKKACDGFRHDKAGRQLCLQVALARWDMLAHYSRRAFEADSPLSRINLNRSH